MATNPGAISAIPVEVFQPYIVEKLRKENPFLNCAVDESKNVLGGSVVHIPQAGASPSVVKNRSSFPAAAVQRGDSFVTYPLDVFTTTPSHVTWHEENENSYDKTDSVLNDHTATLVESVGDNMLYAWIKGLKQSSGAYVNDVIPVANRITTSGTALAVNAEDGQTGTRKALTYKELQKAQAMMNKAGVPKTERYCLLESYMYQQFLDSLSANQMAAFQGSADLKNGVVGRFAGFDIMERASVLAFASNGTPLVPGAAFEATTNIGCLCWQKLSVSKAAGDIKPFQEIDNPQYYGDIFSALVKMGGRCRRGDWKGVLVIVQSAADGIPVITSASAITATSAAATIYRTVAISNGSAWSVVNDDATDTWLSVEKDGDNVKISVTANTDENATSRSGSITITVDGTTVTKTITVTQAA